MLGGGQVVATELEEVWRLLLTALLWLGVATSGLAGVGGRWIALGDIAYKPLPYVFARSGLPPLYAKRPKVL